METEEKLSSGEEKEIKEVKVIKIGSAIMLNEKLKKVLLEEIAEAVSRKIHIVIVASGAVGFGKILKPELIVSGDNAEEIKTAKNRSWASLGQKKLIKQFDEALGEENVAEMLMTHEDLGNGKKRINNTQTLKNNLQNGIITIINENDTTSTEELNVGDNDQLASHVATIIKQEVCDKVDLVLLTGVEGVLNRKSKTLKGLNISKLNKNILDIFKKIYAKESSESGRGGILPKIIAAIRSTHNGVNTYVGHPKDISEILKNTTGEKNWTRFFGSLNNEQVEIIENYIKENNLDIPEWDYTKKIFHRG